MDSDGKRGVLSWSQKGKKGKGGLNWSVDGGEGGLDATCWLGNGRMFHGTVTAKEEEV